MSRVQQLPQHVFSREVRPLPDMAGRRRTDGELAAASLAGVVGQREERRGREVAGSCELRFGPLGFSLVQVVNCDGLASWDIYLVQ